MPDATPPLSGLRVVDAATMVMVPSAAVVMADFGAEVVKVEPLAGDLNRYGHLIPGMPTHDLDYCYFQNNRSKRSLAIDLKTPQGLEIMQRLLAEADVFFTNTRQRALERLGLDWPSVHRLNRRLIYAHGTGYGDRGAESNKPGYDAVSYWSRSGLELTMFPLEGWLGPITYGSGDHPTGMALPTAVLIALYRRERTGEGSRVTTSLLASGAWSNAITIQARLIDATFHARRPRESPINFAAVYYMSRDRRPFKFTIIDHDLGWPRLCRAAGMPELLDQPRFATKAARAEVTGELVALFDRAFEQADLETLRRRFDEHDVPFSPLATYDDIVEDPQMHANDVFLELADERYGSVRTVNSPIWVEDTERSAPFRAPHLGEHSREILEELGYGGAEIDELMASGIAKGRR